ncbi:MAG TPA: 3-isopropylmalate dehydratase small subunit [Candidatus Saccharimonadales bacterium]|nr:3-isopropylmalate dehydratase small subunit [Candidatus Saccharimonadales bacterium]
MEPFKRVKGIVAPLDRVNVDTDQIIPKQFLKLVQRTGFGQYLFYDWRFHPDGKPKAEFVLNEPKYSGAKILIARANFGCGSSREHAAWSLLDYGFRAIIAPSFADIFYNNCFKNGILLITLDETIIERYFDNVAKHPGFSLEIDLAQQTILDSDGSVVRFAIDPFRKKALLEGLDDIELTLKHAEKIREYESHLRPIQLIQK